MLIGAISAQKNKIKKESKEKWQNMWETSKTGLFTRKLLKNVDGDIQKSLISDNEISIPPVP